MEFETLKFIRREPITDYIEDQVVNIGSGGGSDTIENLLKGADLEAFEFELEGKSIILVGFQRK
mgnify:CR=1 FL=1|tara:strand:+ start:291 stop:482 length:192 start_codon:yes stop_codon:yes gene_type:complete